MSGSLSARQSRTNQPPGSDAVAVPLALARPTTEWHQHIQNRRSDPHIAAQISRGPTGMGRPRCRVGAGGVLFVSGHARSPGCFCGGVWVWVVSVSGMRKPLGACAPRGFLYVWCGGVLLSHTLSGAVPSPCQALASGFGMGPGVSPGAMAAANLLLYGQTLGSAGLWRPGEPDSGRGYVDVSSCGQTMLIAVWCRLQEEDAVQPPGVGMLVLPFVR